MNNSVSPAAQGTWCFDTGAPRHYVDNKDLIDSGTYRKVAKKRAYGLYGGRADIHGVGDVSLFVLSDRGCRKVVLKDVNFVPARDGGSNLVSYDGLAKDGWLMDARWDPKTIELAKYNERFQPRTAVWYAKSNDRGHYNVALCPGDHSSGHRCDGRRSTGVRGPQEAGGILPWPFPQTR